MPKKQVELNKERKELEKNVRERLGRKLELLSNVYEIEWETDKINIDNIVNEDEIINNKCSPKRKQERVSQQIKVKMGEIDPIIVLTKNGEEYRVINLSCAMTVDVIKKEVEMNEVEAICGVISEK